ncbi:hypothetical protein BGX26_001282 [Mortierella sp. AD094]|nr:hypothetical protein BGX26_001282 [Mortierella sp. AD094]
MPYYNERKQLPVDLKAWILIASGDDEEEEEEEEAVQLYALASDSRDMRARIHQPRPDYFSKSHFATLSDDQFRALLEQRG